jgi:hypothetical protein
MWFIHEGEYIVVSSSHSGMSGAAALNGFGYLGLNHAVVYRGTTPEARQLSAVMESAIIPAAEVVKHVVQSYHLLSPVDHGDCTYPVVRPVTHL